MGNETKTPISSELEPIGNGLSLDASDNYPLQPEIARMRGEIAVTQRGESIVESRAFQEYAWLNSDELAVLKGLINDGTMTPENVPSRFTRSVLAHLPSLVTFENCPEILELVVAGQVKEVGQLLEDDDEADALLKMRMVASLYEELSTITSGGARESYELEALALNSQLIKSDLPELKVSSRKIHSSFSNLDIRFRRVQRNLDLGLLEKLPEGEVRGLQSEYYQELLKLIQLAYSVGSGEQGRGGDGGNIGGAIGEFLVLGRVRDRLIKRGHFEKVEASQSFLRQDRTDGNSTANPARPPKRISEKKAFDLLVTNKETGRLSRIEIKKSTRIKTVRAGKYGRSKAALSEKAGWEAEKREIKDKYVPSIDVIAFKLGGSFDEYCALAAAHCEGRVALLSGQKMTDAQSIASSAFGAQVDGQITNIFARRKILSNS